MLLKLAPVVEYSSEIQQPTRTTATLGRRPHTHQAAPFDRDQGRAGSLHPDGRPGRGRAAAHAPPVPPVRLAALV